jgi:hypothetical protein
MTDFRQPWILTPAGKWLSWLSMTAMNLVALLLVATIWVEPARWLRIVALVVLGLMLVVAVGIMLWFWWDLRPWKRASR